MPFPLVNSTKRAAIYARVSTQEQTRGDYPSCESQIEELVSHCSAKGWEVIKAIRDEGFSAGSLKRPGLSELRHLVETEAIDVIVCTWYDRLTRSREFYILDTEFRKHHVDFVTLHDPTDRNTASGRFMEMMLVGAKAYDREQTGEKVRIKMRQRTEKGLWNGGVVPFGFILDKENKMLVVDPDRKSTVQRIFSVYVETRSDFAVRDWLKIHQIASPTGKTVWSVGTIRDLLTNYRYMGKIEVNKHNKGREELPEFEEYYIVKAAHEAIIEMALFERAQIIRREKAQRYPNNPGEITKRTRASQLKSPVIKSITWNKCGRVYPLQGLLLCAHCGSPMSPHYVYHKAGGARRTESYIHHYVCSQYRKYGKDCDHANRVLAKNAEAWMVDRIKNLVESEDTVALALQSACLNSAKDLAPIQEELNRTRAALQKVQGEIDSVVTTITSGEVSKAMVGFLNERANQLQNQREKLHIEQRHLAKELSPAEDHFDAEAFRKVLADFDVLAEEARPEELQQILRLLVRKVEWGNNGSHRLHFYSMPKTKISASPEQTGDADRFDITRWTGCSGRTRTSDQSVNSRPLYH